MFGRFGIVEVIFALAVIILLFGTKKIPLIARGLGEGIRNFKTGVKDPGKIEERSSAEEKTPGNDRD